MWVGSKKPLTKHDLYNLNPKDSSAHINGWVTQFWGEYDLFCEEPSKDPPRLWGSMMNRARKLLYVSSLHDLSHLAHSFLAGLLHSSGSFPSFWVCLVPSLSSS